MTNNRGDLLRRIDLTGLFGSDVKRCPVRISDATLPSSLFAPPRSSPVAVAVAAAAAAAANRRARSSPSSYAAATHEKSTRQIAPLPIGTIVDKYRLEELVGRGGFAVVYRATHLLLRAQVAIKLLRPELVKQRPHLVDQLLDEARCAARIQHPNVVRILDVTHTKAISYIVMEYIEGETLAAAIDRRGALPWNVALGIGTDVARGLRAGLAEGLVHRDIKPANLLLSRIGEAKIVDFGLARALAGHASSSAHQALAEMSSPSSSPTPFSRSSSTNVPGRVGTRGYIAPEVTYASHADFRADMYSLGVTLFECVTGSRAPSPPSSTSPSFSLPGGTPGPVAHVLRAMVRQDPKARPSSYDELLEMLKRARERGHVAR